MYKKPLSKEDDNSFVSLQTLIFGIRKADVSNRIIPDSLAHPPAGLVVTLFRYIFAESGDATYHTGRPSYFIYW